MKISGRQSVYKLVGLPEQFGVVLLTLGLVLTISPYLANSDFGVFKVPDFPPDTRGILKVLGPLFLLLMAALFLPVWKSNALEGKADERLHERRYGQHQPDVPAARQPELPSSGHITLLQAAAPPETRNLRDPVLENRRSYGSWDALRGQEYRQALCRFRCITDAGR
jgi:hypothetical protein